MTYYIGIDPGARWTGITVLQELREEVISIEFAMTDSSSDNGFGVHFPTRVLDRLLSTLSSNNQPVVVVIENYQVRPVGHQQWTDNPTGRVIGSMEYVCQKHRVEVRKESPADPKKGLERLGVDHWSNQVRGEWKIQEYDHVLSSLRVALLSLAKERAHVIAPLARSKVRIRRMEDHGLIRNLVGIKKLGLWFFPG